LPKENELSFSKAEGSTPMEPLEKRDTDTGKNDGQTPILANENQSMGGQLKAAPTKSELASIESIASQLALLQNDCSELQSLGLKIAILARMNKLYFVLEVADHELSFDTGTGHILFDGVPVLKAMQADTGNENKKPILARGADTGKKE
jgi:hypothetical protein